MKKSSKFIWIVLAALFLLIPSCSDDNDETTITPGDTDQESGEIDENTESDEEETFQPPEITCDSPWNISSDPWTPTQIYDDMSYRQEQSRLIEDDLPTVILDGVEGERPAIFAVVALENERSVLAATGAGLLRVSETGSFEKVAAWPEVAYSQLIQLDNGKFVALSGRTIYVGDLDSAPTTTEATEDVISIVASSSGKLWRIEEPSTLLLWDATSGQTTETYGPSAAFGIHDLCEQDGKLILGTTLGAWELDRTDGSQKVRVAAEDLPKPNVYGVECLDDGKLWLATENGLVGVDGETLTILRGREGVPYRDLRGISRTSDGLLLLTTEKGLITYLPNTKEWDYYHTRYWIPDWYVYDVARFSDGTLFVATQGGVGIIYGTAMTLADKAEVIDLGYYTRHNRFGMFSQCRLGAPGDLSQPITHDDDNDGQWTNQYLASQCFRYAVTGDETARLYASEAAEAMVKLLTVTGKKGFFSRSIVPPDECLQKLACSPDCGEWHAYEEENGEQWCWKGDTSADEYVGHMFGLSLFYDLVADETQKQKVREAFSELHLGMIEHGYTLEDIDGEVTTHGQFSPEFMNLLGRFGDAGLNSAMILGGLRATYHMTGDTRFLEAFYHLAIDEGYTEWVRRIQEINHIAHINHDSEEMSYLAMATLIRYETDPCLMAYWQEGLDWLWESQRIERNPEFNMLYAWMRHAEENDLDNSVRTMKEMYLHGIKWEVINSHRADYDMDPELDRHGDEQATTVFPYDQDQAMRWSENPFRLDHPGNGGYEEMLHPWLLPYWLGRYLGLISSPVD